MSQVYPVPEAMAEHSFINNEQYLAMYERSVTDSDGFWSEQADKFLTWNQRWETVSEANIEAGEIGWFLGGKLNVTVNCIDRHLKERGDQTAIIWEGDDPGADLHISYQQLADAVGKLANGLRARGVTKGDRVCIYMPMVPEAAYAMLACARIGAIHSVVFGGFSPQSLKDRILDSDCQTVITADEGVRGGKPIPLKEIPSRHSLIVPMCTQLLPSGAQEETFRGRKVATSGITS